MTPLLLSIPSERKEALEIARSVPGTLVPPECPSILHAAALIRDLGIFITPDTGLVHVASAFGIPVIGLYCPNEGHLPLWHPWRVECEVLLDKEKVENIPVSDVEDAVSRLASRTAVMDL